MQLGERLEEEQLQRIRRVLELIAKKKALLKALKDMNALVHQYEQLTTQYSPTFVKLYANFILKLEKTESTLKTEMVSLMHAVAPQSNGSHRGINPLIFTPSIAFAFPTPSSALSHASPFLFSSASASSSSSSSSSSSAAMPPPLPEFLPWTTGEIKAEDSLPPHHYAPAHENLPAVHHHLHHLHQAPHHLPAATKESETERIISRVLANHPNGANLSHLKTMLGNYVNIWLTLKGPNPEQALQLVSGFQAQYPANEHLYSSIVSLVVKKVVRPSSSFA